MNIAQDCELFKAKKGYTRQFFQSYTTYVIYDHVHKIYPLITTLQGYLRLKITSHSSISDVLDVSHIIYPTLLPIDISPLLLPINNHALRTILLIKNPDFITNS